MISLLRKFDMIALKCATVAFVLLTAVAYGQTPNQAGPASASVDQSGYFPGDIVNISASGFRSSETVNIRLSYESGGESRIEDLSSQANGQGEVNASWTMPSDVEPGDTISLSATSEDSQISVSTSFYSANTFLTLTSSIGGDFCLGVVNDSIVICARLQSMCKNGSLGSVANRPIVFFRNSDDCGVDQAQSGDDTVYTNDFGIACIRVPVPATPQVVAVRAKFAGESKPDNCPLPGNSPCSPDSENPQERCVNLSNANACLEFIAGGDLDGDGIVDADDNCPCVSNPLQEDFDLDGMGDSCFLPSYLRPLTIVVRATDNGALIENPIDPQLNLRVTDPDFLQIGADSLDVIVNDFDSGAAYYQIDGNDSIVIEYPKTGTYIIEVIPEASSTSALPSSSFTLLYKVSIRTDGTVETETPPLELPTSGEIDTVGFISIPYTFGDANGDRKIDISDAVFIIAVIFTGGVTSIPEAASDANCDGRTNIFDFSLIMHYIFREGPPPGCF